MSYLVELLKFVENMEAALHIHVNLDKNLDHFKNDCGARLGLLIRKAMETDNTNGNSYFTGMITQRIHQLNSESDIQL